jgi:GT2 family glycosyltransferase
LDKIKKEKVYIIIVTYNGLKWISNCLSSTKPYSVIVIDNNSSDGTPDFIKKNFPEVILFEQKKNLGFGKANNVGMAYALRHEADYVFLLNQDAVALPGTIEKLVRRAEKNKSYGILSPVHLNGTGDFLDDSFLYYLKNQGSNEFLSDLVMNKPKKDIYEFRMINAAAWLLPIRTIKTVGGFHPMFFLYGEDDNYCQRVIFHSLKVGVVTNAFILHDSKNNNAVQPDRGSEKYFEKFRTLLKVKYANVNSEDYKRMKELRSYYYKQAFKNVVSFNIKEGRINFKKARIVSTADFLHDINETKKAHPAFLSHIV